MVKEINSSNFANEIKNGQILVDFNATWCGPCRMLKPILSDFSEQASIKVCSVDIDQNEELASKYNIYSIPCLIIFHDGQEIKRSVGLLSQEELEKWVGEEDV